MAILTKRLMSPPPGAFNERPQRTVAQSVSQDAEISFATVADPDDFEALRSEWSALFDTCGRPHQVFQTFEWLAIWAGLYIDKSTRLRVVTGRIEGRLVLVWPLVMRKAFGVRILSGMGEPLSQYSDALIAADLGDAGEDAAFAYVKALPVDVVSFRRVRDDAAVAPLLRRNLGAPANRQASPFVDLAGARSAEAFEKRFAGKLRSSRRRRRRRLEERGMVTFTHHGPSPEAAALVATALDFKRQWARRTGVLAPALRDARFERFFVAAALAGTLAPGMRVSALRCAAQIVGIEISVACKGRLFGHVLAPCPDFDAAGVGGILAEATIVSALEQGYTAVDLLAPADPYKLEWTTTSVGVGDYSMSLGLLGHLYTRLWLRFGRSAIKTIVSRLQPAIARLSRRLELGAQPERPRRAW